MYHFTIFFGVGDVFCRSSLISEAAPTPRMFSLIFVVRSSLARITSLARPFNLPGNLTTSRKSILRCGKLQLKLRKVARPVGYAWSEHSWATKPTGRQTLGRETISATKHWARDDWVTL